MKRQQALWRAILSARSRCGQYPGIVRAGPVRFSSSLFGENSDTSYSQQRQEFLFGEAPKSFRSIGLLSDLCDSIESNDMRNATVIQAAAFDAVVAKENVLISAETGTGDY